MATTASSENEREGLPHCLALLNRRREWINNLLLHRQCQRHGYLSISSSPRVTDPFILQSRLPYTPNMRACNAAQEPREQWRCVSVNAQSTSVPSQSWVQQPAGDYTPSSSTGDVVAEPTEILLWVSARCANSNWQSLIALCSNVLSTPPLVRPSANMSRVSTQCIRLIIPWLPDRNQVQL